MSLDLERNSPNGAGVCQIGAGVARLDAFVAEPPQKGYISKPVGNTSLRL